MKVLHICTSENAGGAAIAARRLVSALRQRGTEASMLVRDSKTADPLVVALPSTWRNKYQFIAERASIFVRQHFSRHNLWAIDPATHGIEIVSHPAFCEADIIHLHWWNQGMLSLEGLRHILESGKPVVWTMHDMWPMTGICHHADDCRHWHDTQCGHCPLLLNGKNDADLSRTTYLHKLDVYGTSHIQFVACSKWLADLAQQSPLLKGHAIASIPNAIDTQYFTPASREEARRKLGLPLDQYLVLFVAYKLTDPQKGVQYLQQATRGLTSLGNRPLAVVLAGGESALAAEGFTCPTHDMGYVAGRSQMRLLYQAADVLAMPTLRDNLPNTIAEGMSCGLPCVGFRIGGLPQMIDHGQNGYLANYRDADDFRKGLLWIAEQPSMASPARLKAIQCYSEASVAARYMQVYEQALVQM